MAGLLARERGHLAADALFVVRPAVVAADEAVAFAPAERERYVAVRASIEEADRSALIAEQDQRRIKDLASDRLLTEIVRATGDVP